MHYFLFYKKSGTSAGSILKKTLLIMKMIFFMMLVMVIGVHAEGRAQKITLSMKNVKVDRVFAEIAKQTNYRFLYSDDTIDKSASMDIDVKDATLNDALDKISDQWLLQYKMMSGTIMVAENKKAIRKNVPAEATTEPVQDDVTVSGVVMDKQGNVLTQASVNVKGVAGRGTNTDAAGRFTLTVPVNSVLVVSFIGYEAKEVTVTNNRSITVVLDESFSELEEVVVTSFGIQRDRKTLGYGVSEMKSEELAKSPTTDVTNALSGKVAGVQVSGAGGGFAGSNVTIRGFSTFTGSNQPLYVVDGIPLDNSGGGNSVNTGVVNSSRISDINPQDIENISVLKGAAATVLYGSRAASGVILITTKKGKQGTRNQVNVGTNTAVGTVSRFPDFQNEYAQGSNGNYINNVAGSWGPRIEGQTVRNWFGEDEVLRAYPDNIRDILQNSISSQNDLSFSGATDRYDYRISYGYTKETGLVPNNELTRNNLSVNVGTQVSDKLKIGTSFSYTNNSSDRTQSGNQGANPLWRGIYAPRSYDLTNLPYEDEEGNQLWYAAEDHPYWSINHITNRREVNRFYGNVNLKYDILDWLQADLKVGADVFNSASKGFDDMGVRSNANTNSAGAGGLSDQSSTVRNINSYFTVTGNRKIGEDINVLATVGNEIIANYSSSVSAVGLGIVLPGFANQRNFLTFNPSGSITEQRAVGVFADLVVDYKNFLSVNVKARNDFSSTLAPGNRSIFYPALAISWVPTEAFPSLKSDVLSSLKIRANIGEVGKGTGPYDTNTYYGRASAGDGLGSTAVNFPFNGLAGYTLNNGAGNPQLQPEFTREIELGTEVSLFSGRVFLDGSVYRRDTRNLIFSVPVPSSSGFTSVTTNAGKLSTKGLELLLRVVPIKKENFNWDASFNFTTFKSIVEELAPGVDNISLGGFTSPNIRLVSGEEYGQIWSNAYQRNNDGQMIIGANGLPRPTSAVQRVGNPNPKFVLGWNNTLTFKDFTFSFLFDFKYKGDQLSRTIGDLQINGVAAETAEHPRFNADGTPSTPYIFEGVLEDGTPNNIPVTAQQYYGLQGKYVAWEGYVLDATFVKLREANLSYRLPVRLLGNQKVIKAVNLSVYGRNLFMYAPNYPHLDPEQNLLGISNARGLEFGIQPTARTIGGSIRLTL
ncbi:TonB-linked outer membrane protein, SusC/RagA family [Parapedobacter koreensis]|uniref:TonB-linked outer membrane protein, SusC/RagA family n=2 Tax=Parapedobacter koreensis TaxID=332977 RepID=A0A1H7RRY7_9SPHI|nr:TonB-linked outer membrane protein, SusC/RagA family [Parapedobacter koreensis]